MSAFATAAGVGAAGAAGVLNGVSTALVLNAALCVAGAVWTGFALPRVPKAPAPALA
jgi:hypothetical protein